MFHLEKVKTMNLISACEWSIDYDIDYNQAKGMILNWIANDEIIRINDFFIASKNSKRKSTVQDSKKSSLYFTGQLKRSAKKKEK